MNGRPWQMAASFRGRPFFVSRESLEAGRRITHHEFPNRDKGYGEDLGRKDNAFSLDGYTTQRSPGGYAAARDAIVEAARKPGAGKLVHPYYGEMELICLGISVRHDKAENGVARFTLSFLDASADQSPATGFDLKSLASGAADAGMLASLKDFALTLSGVPGYVREAAAGVLADLGAALDDAFPLASAAIDTASGTSALLRSGLDLLDEGQRFFQDALHLPLLFSRRAFGLAEGAASGANGAANSGANAATATATAQATQATAQATGKHLAGLFRLLTPASGSWNAAFDLQRSFLAYGEHLPAVPLRTANRRIQAANQEAVINLARRLSLFEAARCVPFMDLDSRAHALELREELMEHFDLAAVAAKSDELYRAIEAMRRAALEDLNSRAPSLALLTGFTPTATLPALAVSYELYETPHRAAEIVSRNKVIHPGRLPGGVTLEVFKQ